MSKNKMKLDVSIEYTLKFEDGTEETKDYKTREVAEAEAKERNAELIAGAAKFKVV